MDFEPRFIVLTLIFSRLRSIKLYIAIFCSMNIYQSNLLYQLRIIDDFYNISFFPILWYCRNKNSTSRIGMQSLFLFSLYFLLYRWFFLINFSRSFVRFYMNLFTTIFISAIFIRNNRFRIQFFCFCILLVKDVAVIQLFL